MESNIKLSEMMNGFDKAAVEKKLREMGMGQIADKLHPLNEKEIEKLIKSNPQIVKKATEMLNNRR